MSIHTYMHTYMSTHGFKSYNKMFNDIFLSVVFLKGKNADHAVGRVSFGAICAVGFAVGLDKALGDRGSFSKLTRASLILTYGSTNVLVPPQAPGGLCTELAMVLSEEAE